METCCRGRTDYLSTMAILGEVVLLRIFQEEADLVMRQVIKAGVNHNDAAPEYGLTEGAQVEICKLGLNGIILQASALILKNYSLLFTSN